MVVANDEIYAVTAGIGDFVDCFDATIEHNYQFYTHFDGVVYALYRDAIAFFVARRNVVLHVGVVVSQIFVYQSHCRCAVNVVVAVYQYLLFRPHGSV